MQSLPILALSIAGTCLFAACVSSAGAAPLASGGAYDLSVHVAIAGVSQFDVTPFAAITFSNQTAAGSDSQQSVDVNAGGTLALLHAGDVSVVGEWIPDTPFVLVGTRARVDNLDLQLGGTGTGALLALTSDLLQSTTVIGGTCPAGAASKTSASTAASPLNDYVFFDTFEARGLAVEGGSDTQGVSVTTQTGSLLGLPAQPAPNTALTLPAGLGVLVLNERTTSGDGISGLHASTNAAHLTLSALGVLTGEIVIAHSEAAIDCH